MQHLNTLTANLRAAGLLGLAVGLAVAVALAGVVASVVWVAGRIKARRWARGWDLARGESHTVTTELRRRADGRWAVISAGRWFAAVLLALLPLAGCLPVRAPRKDALTAKIQADVKSEDDFLRWTDERQGQIVARCRVQAVGPEECTRRLKGHQETVAHMRALLRDRTVTLDMAVKLIDERPADIGGAQ